MSTEHRAQSTEHRAQSTEHRAQSTEHRAQSTEHRAQSTEALTNFGFSFDELKKRKAELLQLLSQTAPELISDHQLNLDALKKLLGEENLAPTEHYELSWAGKSAARREIQKTTSHTLKPSLDNPEHAQHMLIEGENLEVLRVLQKSYYGKVKMIYIDPPYNTGSDSFVYPDDYSETLDEYQKRTGEKNEQGFLNKQSLWKKNSKESGQYHSAWLSMMYPRLYLARNLLRDDGVIFIHIDENEVDSLNLICKEIFGEENFINIITVKTKVAGVSGSAEGKSLQGNTEYILLYAKKKEDINLLPIYQKTKLFEHIENYQKEGKSWKYATVIKEIDNRILLKENEVQGIKIYGYETLETTSVSSFAREKKITEEQVYNQYADRIIRTTNAQSSVRQTVINETQGFNYPIYGYCYAPIKGKNQNTEIEVLYKSTNTDLSQRNMVMFLSDVVTKIENEYYYLNKKGNLWDDIDYNNLTKEGDTAFPNGKKPIRLISRMLEMQSSTNSSDIILDFFAGSGTTAHAVMELNAEDGGNRQSISVQMPELLDEKSEAYKAGYRTIADITRARIDKVITKLKTEQPDKTQDLACAYFTLAPSNFKVWSGELNTVDAVRQQLEIFQQAEKNQENTVVTQHAMLTELLLKHGLGVLGVHAISQPKKLSCGITIYRVLMDNDKALWLCFEPYRAEFKQEIVKEQPAQVILLNSCFTGENADEQLSNLKLELQHYEIGLLVI